MSSLTGAVSGRAGTRPAEPAIYDAAQRLRDAVRTRRPSTPVRTLLPEGDVDAAYAVQAENVSRAVAEGGRVAGHKIGLTSAAVQRQLGVEQPDFGVLMADMVYGDDQLVPLDRLLQPRVEAEIAFVLGADLTMSCPTVVDVVRATDHVLPAIEVVDSRIANWDISIVDTIADNASSGVLALGSAPRRLSDVDMRLAGMVIEHRGEPVSVGAAAACLGSPLGAVVWLARELARRGSPLRAGQVVLSGALGPMVPVSAAGSFEARIEGLGSVRATFVGGEPVNGEPKEGG